MYKDYKEYNKIFNNNYYKINNDNIIIENKLKENYKYNDYITVSNFSDLFRQKKQTNTTFNAVILGIRRRSFTISELSAILASNIFTQDEILKISNEILLNYPQISANLDKYQKATQNQVQTQTDTTTSNQQTTQNLNIQGRQYDASSMWSPISSAGKIYEWNRGVIEINPIGEIKKESLDGTLNHHEDATIRISKLFGITISNSVGPFDAAIKANKNGLVVIQTDGDNCFLYLPEQITIEQKERIIESLLPRRNFTFAFTHKEEVFDDDITYEIISDYLNQQLSMNNSNRRLA